MNGSKLSKVNHEKNLGVTISNDLKLGRHYSGIVEKKKKLREWSASPEELFSINL